MTHHEHHEVTDGLNSLLADYMVYYQKLRNYHWNVQGQEFFKLHEEFEKAYNQTADWVDELAERILALGGAPHATLHDFVDEARLNEDPEVPGAQQMVKNLTDDIEKLNNWTLSVVDTAEEARDRTTTNLLDDIVDAQEKRLWMFETFLEG